MAQIFLVCEQTTRKYFHYSFQEVNIQELITQKDDNKRLLLAKVLEWDFLTAEKERKERE